MCSRTVTFGIEPTQDSFAMIENALRGARTIFRPGFRYFKAGVMLDDLTEAASVGVDMFASRHPKQSLALMNTMDALNGRYGRGCVRPAVTGIERSWKTKAEFRSHRYTTVADEMLKVTAGALHW